MFKSILTGLALGVGGYMFWRYFNPDTITTPDGEGVGLFDGITGDFFQMSNAVSPAAGMGISIAGLAHIKKWEGFRANRYLDEAGKPTIGYGHLLKSWETFDTVTLAEANALLVKDVSEAEAAVNRLVKVRLQQYQFDALVSFVFNVGVGAFAGSTMLKLLNQGKYNEVKAQFGRWIWITKNGQKVISNGLFNRRTGDTEVWSGVYRA